MQQIKNHAGTLFIALAIIIGLWIVGGAYKYKFKSQENISVTGLAEKDFTSDLSFGAALIYDLVWS